MEGKAPSKVLALAGGGPVTGLHIGALEGVGLFSVPRVTARIPSNDAVRVS